MTMPWLLCFDTFFSVFRDPTLMVDNLQQDGSAAFQASTTIASAGCHPGILLYFSEAEARGIKCHERVWYIVGHGISIRLRRAREAPSEHQSSS
jgi:hypothetical protein